MDLSNIKMLLGITDTGKDNLLNYLADSAEKQAQDYCNRTDTVDGMKPVIDGVVVRRYRGGYYGQESAPDKPTSVKEGEVTVQLKTIVYDTSSALSDDEKKSLNPYRNLFKL